MADSDSITLTPAELARFWSKVDKDGPVPAHCPELGPCWVWTASTDTAGYGQFGLQGKLRSAHRVSFLIVNGRWPTPNGLHRCDNPPCVRDEHLFEGTKADNRKDMISKGRAVFCLGERNRSARLTEGDIVAIRSSGMSLREAAAIYDVGYTAISKIRRRRTWNHVA